MECALHRVCEGSGLPCLKMSFFRFGDFLIAITFDELIKKISNTSLIISCHGAPSHAASAFNKKIIDIYDKSEELFYKRWNSHFRRYNFLYRNNFRNLADEILEKL